MATQYLTNDDYNNYGSELVDLTQRAALQAVEPKLTALESQNAALRKRLAVEARRNLDAAVERAIPNYREIDRDPAWHRWLLGIDEFTGRVRQQLLNDAIASGSDARVAAFFRGFQQANPAGGAQAPERAASGRTRSSPFAKQIYTREMIGQLYERHRKGEFAEAAWNQIEQDIFNAQHEGRVRDAPYLTK